MCRQFIWSLPVKLYDGCGPNFRTTLKTLIPGRGKSYCHKTLILGRSKSYCLLNFNSRQEQILLAAKPDTLGWWEEWTAGINNCPCNFFLSTATGGDMISSNTHNWWILCRLSWIMLTLFFVSLPNLLWTNDLFLLRPPSSHSLPRTTPTASVRPSAISGSHKPGH